MLYQVFVFFLQALSSSNAIQNTEQLISEENELFKEAVKITSITLGVLVVCGLLFEYCFLRPRHRMIESAKRKFSHFEVLNQKWNLEEKQRFYRKSL